MRGGPGGRCFKNAARKIKVPSFFLRCPRPVHRNIIGEGRVVSSNSSAVKQERGMFGNPAALLGLAGVAFLAGSFIPASFSIASLAQAERPLTQLPLRSAAAAARGDRMARPLPAQQPATISTVELVGIAQATVI